ncbi:MULTISPECIES: hypothetical protein [Mameliella]|uniref:hypothetical protein n=1 Tax=Mameliella TaxID=1434019 RepID=UPI000B52994B|nr:MULTISPECIES: hypothetical protein [Mameliella]MCR9273490.1 hypothetical protein [Paracoccaceae bacterium]OWV54966.1 hypothetical protein CDZ98_20215 [Mameliella alba]
MVRMFKSALVTTALVLAGALPAAAQQGLVEVPINNSFSVNELNWDSALGKVEFAWAVLDIRGVTYVCGASSASTSFAHRKTKTVFRKGWVKVGNTKVLKDLSYFTRAPRNTDLGTVRARCKPLPGKAGAANDFLLGFDPVRVRL